MPSLIGRSLVTRGSRVAAGRGRLSAYQSGPGFAVVRALVCQWGGCSLASARLLSPLAGRSRALPIPHPVVTGARSMRDRQGLKTVMQVVVRWLKAAEVAAWRAGLPSAGDQNVLTTAYYRRCYASQHVAIGNSLSVIFR